MEKKSPKSQELYMIAHSHWDREWYNPFEKFRMHLVHLVDEIIDVCQDSAYTHFNLDGQTITIEDYLEIRPERKDIVLQLIKTGRLGVGPWYNQPDQWTSGELIVRNLLRGYQLGEQYGGWQKIGYCPDLFGNIAQIPQIMQGVGIDNYLYGRGLGDEFDDPKFTNEYYWEAPDGSRVLTYYMPFGYANAKNHPITEDEFNTFMLFAYGRISKSKTNVHFIGCGGDHYIPQRETPELIKKFNANPDVMEELQGGRLYHSNLTAFIQGIKDRLSDKDPLMVIRGELRQGRTDVFEPGSISSRMYLKQANALTWRKACYLAEPLALYAHWESYGKKQYKAFVDLAWKFLLQNQPHDSICGCSIDDVHRDMENRFAHSNQIMDELMQEILQNYMMRQKPSGLKGIPIILFNPHVHLVRPAIHFRVANVKLHTEADIIFDPALDLSKTYELKTAHGDILPMAAEKILYKENHEMLEITAIGPEMHGIGLYTVFLCETPSPTSSQPLTQDYENAWMKLVFHPNGSFDLTVKASQQRFTNLHYLEDQADAGDGYDFYALPGDIPLTSLQGTATITGMKTAYGACFMISYSIPLPLAMNDDRSARLTEIRNQIIQTTMNIWDHIPRIDFTTTLKNRIKDHRLRAVFPTPIVSANVMASSIYDVIDRGIGNERVANSQVKWVQKAVPTSHTSEFVDLWTTKTGGFLMMNKGLPEYEARRISPGDQSPIALIQTLFRSCRYEGGVMPGRGRAGDEIPTPEGQLLRALTLEYAIALHPHDWIQDTVFKFANEYILPFGISGGKMITPGRRADQTDQFDKETQGLAPQISLVSFSNPNVILTTFKQAESLSGCICRVFNPTTISQSTELLTEFTIKDAKLTNLLELDTPSPNIGLKSISPKALQVDIPPKKIVTLHIQIAEA